MFRGVSLIFLLFTVRAWAADIDRRELLRGAAVFLAASRSEMIPLAAETAGESELEGDGVITILSKGRTLGWVRYSGGNIIDAALAAHEILAEGAQMRVPDWTRDPLRKARRKLITLIASRCDSAIAAP